MRKTLLNRLFLAAAVAGSILPFSGCEKSTEPDAPEMGSVEAYLAEHPEELEDDPDEAQDEGAEFDAGS